MADEQIVPESAAGGLLGASRRRLMAAGGLAALGLATAACGVKLPGSAASSAGPAPAFDSSYEGFSLNAHINDDSLVKIQTKGAIVIGSSGDWPYSYLDSKTNAFTGIDADILNLAMKMLKVPTLTIQTVTFDGLIPGLLDGRFDIIGDSIHYTATRGKVVQFSFPTYYYSEWLILSKGKFPNAQQIADMKDHTVGAELGTNYAEWVQKTPGVIFKGYKQWQDMSNDLKNGRLDAAVHDQPIVAAYLKEHPDAGYVLAEGYAPHQLKNPAGYSRYALRQTDFQLRDDLSRAIEWMQDNGAITKILEKWGLSGYNN